MAENAAHREFLAGQLAALAVGEQVVAAFDDSRGGTFTIAGELRSAGSKALLLGPTMVRTGAGVVTGGLRWIELAVPHRVPPVGFPARVAQILIAHQRLNSGYCLCGWDKWGASHAEHVVEMLTGGAVLQDATVVIEQVRKVFTDMWSHGDWEGQVSIGFAATFDQHVDELLADYAPTTNELLSAISRWIDESPSYQGISPEAADWRRTMKLVEELGEAVAAYAGSIGENPRKGVIATRVHFQLELLDVITAGMGALMHFHNNDPAADILGYVIEHIRTRAVRAIPHGLVMPTGKEPLWPDTAQV